MLCRIAIGMLKAISMALRSCSRSSIASPALFLTGIVSTLLSAEPQTPENGFSRSALKVDQGKVGFTQVSSKVTGIDFTLRLTGDLSLTHAVAHNGSGVALGDVDGDGWVDIYFSNLQGPNKLYRNLGDWRFEEMPVGAAACVDQLSTAATLVDVDGDHDLDLIVNGIASGTRVFLNDGRGSFEEVEDSGLSRSASATSMALADIDGDGDLDLYCTHYIDIMHLADPSTRFALAKRNGQWVVSKVNGQSTLKPPLKDRFQILSDGSVRELPEVDGLYLNEGGGRFKAIQSQPGVFTDINGKPMSPPRDWGLAVMFRDLNQDGAPDLYICNDNASPDRIWLNSGNGTFREIEPLKIRHTSRSSMGLDFADINRDGYDDIFVVDMLARRHAKRMTQLVRDRPDISAIKRIEARPRYNRNTLFMGRADGHFVETALMAGIAATDWSWSPIFIDVDLDGYEDILVTNGFSFDVMDQDSHDRFKKMRLSTEELKRSRQFHPAWPTPNVAFRNRGDGTFSDMSQDWGFDFEGISYGMALGDLDNDGDMDVVVNHLNQPAGLYRNDAPAARVKIVLKGISPNTQGIGARIEFTEDGFQQSQEMISGGRYLSGDQATRVFAVRGEPHDPRELRVTWRNGNRSLIQNVLPNHVYTVEQATSQFQSAKPPSTKPRPIFEDGSDLLNYIHVEAPLVEHPPQPLLPSYFIESGPDLSVFDHDGDGWEDLMISEGYTGEMRLFQSEKGMKFSQTDISIPPGTSEPIRWKDPLGYQRWLAKVLNTASDAVSIEPMKQLHQAVIRGGANLFVRPMSVSDMDSDGDLDAFIGGIPIPGRYPETTRSSIWFNDEGTLKPADSYARTFGTLGIVNAATFFELDGNSHPDLALAMEWGSIRIFQNNTEGYVDVTESLGLNTLLGWWTSIVAGDFDGDGRMDLAAGNWGRNGPYALYPTDRFRIWYGDWDGNGTLELVEGWWDHSRWLPVADRTTLAAGIPDLQIFFPTHQQFSDASVEMLLGDKIKDFQHREANHFESMVFLNRGNRFEPVSLPEEAQHAPVFSVHVLDFDGDGIEDLFLGQNAFGDARDLTREDGGFGCLLRGNGDGSFQYVDPIESGISIMGEQRGSAVADFDHDGRPDIAVTQKNAPIKMYLNRSPQRGLRVTLKGPLSNPHGIGARMRIVYTDDQRGPCRMIQSGSGYRSQDASTQILGLKDDPTGLWVAWPGGLTREVSIQANQREIQVQFDE